MNKMISVSISESIPISPQITPEMYRFLNTPNNSLSCLDLNESSISINVQAIENNAPQEIKEARVCPVSLNRTASFIEVLLVLFFISALIFIAVYDGEEVSE